MAEKLNWSSLPNIPRAMVEFALQNPAVMGLLGGDYRSRTVRRAALERRRKFAIPPGLGHILREGYIDVGITPEIEANLAALEQPGALAIVTGQQAGLFGGPLFTFYKALTTIMLAQQLSAETSAPVVPLFWMETADADFGEVNRAALPPVDDVPRRLVYTPDDMVSGKSVCLHTLRPEITGLISRLREWLAELPYSRDYIAVLERAYKPGRRMTEAFREIMTKFFGSLGLITLDARHPALVARAAPFWEAALERPLKLNQAFAASSRQLTELRLPWQVQLRDDALPVMHIAMDGIRRRLLGEQNNWRIGKDGPPFDDVELKRLAREENAALTPSALLRPLLQDFLLPTWIYVGGPAEIAYQAQIGLAYDLLNIPRPLVAPRLTATLIEHPTRRWLERQGWTVGEALGGRELLLRKRGSSEALSELFDNGTSHFEGWVKRIAQAAEDADIELGLELDQAGRKINYQWNKLKAMALNKIARRDKTRVEHTDKLTARLLPDGVLQERHDSAVYYVAAYGPGFMNALMVEADAMTPQHLVIDLGE
ncbi:MAG: bacillithiol biosynthesis cysteine-adding enzyme BshC [Calditrichaeota bacterium]|nr:bacillithiol biosynthesis cysteine-adding enzyme BshC [Calditrichota bacterium]